ncbi:Protoheme IX farnesyltransferase [Candidatus Annandia adelgestsuga]|uniref:Protoheme IX farnesyltransferase n=1 Tax=Candidatus Annandia adelgestsuga TaxID=1302411 RepID=A0A3S9J825_9ENTR|nr:heme o synthase [Candidatus Annandia adelgestsuga]AZP36382.1 Protoheme IX farnesyltransferase [Candidatus Annandia adelgestsuga]
MNNIKIFLKIIKPGIILGNILSLITGFFFTDPKKNNFKILIITIISVIFIISSCNILNNIIDINIDCKMKRTNNRLLVKKKKYIKIVFFISIIINLIGFILLYYKINNLVLFISIIGFLVYVIFYSLILKRYSIYSTLFGSISGAITPIIGYCSINNKLDLKSLLLFIVFFLWQIPHFYSISIIYLKDYEKIKIPIFVIIKGIKKTKYNIIFYIILFSIIHFFLITNYFNNFKCILISILLDILWIIISILSLITLNNKLLSRLIFILSILIIITFNITSFLNYNFKY